MNIDTTKVLRYSRADNSAIDAHVFLPNIPESVPYTFASGDTVYNDAISGLYGPILPYAVPTMGDVTRNLTINQECARRIDNALQGKGQSMLREEMALNKILSDGGTLDGTQTLEMAVFSALNDWETAMVDKREELIGTGNVAAALLDNTWPAPPVLLTSDFLSGF